MGESLTPWSKHIAAGRGRLQLPGHGAARRLRLPERAVEALEKHRASLREADRYDELGLVFTSEAGTALDSANVRRHFRVVCAKAGLEPGEWTPRELRHSFVSLMSEVGVPLEEIARLVGHSSTKVTETVYRKQLRPVLTEGARTMDMLFDLPHMGNASD
ncbi:MAG: tyrosine-type recombinase/integrase, partial [Mycetocola sp.]